MIIIGIGDLEFPDHSAEDRAKLIEVMNTVKDTLDAAITRVVKNKKETDVNSKNKRSEAKLIRRISGEKRS